MRVRVGPTALTGGMVSAAGRSAAADRPHRVGLRLAGHGDPARQGPVAHLSGTDGDAAVARPGDLGAVPGRSEEHTSELQSRGHLVCRLLLEKKKKKERDVKKDAQS